MTFFIHLYMAKIVKRSNSIETSFSTVLFFTTLKTKVITHIRIKKQSELILLRYSYKKQQIANHIVLVISLKRE